MKNKIHLSHKPLIIRKIYVYLAFIFQSTYLWNMGTISHWTLQCNNNVLVKQRNCSRFVFGIANNSQICWQLVAGGREGLPLESAGIIVSGSDLLHFADILTIHHVGFGWYICVHYSSHTMIVSRTRCLGISAFLNSIYGPEKLWLYLLYIALHLYVYYKFTT